MKQFLTVEALEKWIENWIDSNCAIDESKRNIWDITPPGWGHEKEIVNALIAEGYDVDDLTADGHAYEIGGHTNNGWTSVEEMSKY